jgi:hypothetical protein
LLTDEKLEDILTQLQISPWKSLREAGVHELKPVNAPQRVQFCNWMLRNVHDGFVDYQLPFITDEAYFHLRGYVNCQKT